MLQQPVKNSLMMTIAVIGSFFTAITGGAALDMGFFSFVAFILGRVILYVMVALLYILIANQKIKL